MPHKFGLMQDMEGICGVFGKHPKFGDFISSGVEPDVQNGLQGWLDGMLPELRDGLADAWNAQWDAAPTLRFWVGRGLAGKTLAGVLRPSCDGVGRRYPLVLVAQGAAISAPVVDANQGFYDHAQQLLDTCDDIKNVPADLAQTVTPESQDLAQGPLIWAHNEAGNLDDLLSAAAIEDQRRSVTARSYWWVKPARDGEHAMWLGHAGLPDAQAIGWLLFGRTITVEANDA